FFGCERTVLTHHPSSALIRRGSVVERLVASCDHQDVADAHLCLSGDLGSEKPAGHCLGTAEHIRIAVALASPSVQDCVRLGGWVQIDMQHPRFSPEMADSVESWVTLIQ